MANKNGKLILQNNTLFPKTMVYNVFDERGVSLDHLISGLPLGMIIPSTVVQTDAGLHLLDGGELSRSGVYAEFCTWLISKYNADPTSVPVVAGTTDAEKIAKYEEELDAHNGQCGKFAICSDFVKLPTITRFIESLTSLSDIGKVLDAGVPNIAGVLGDGSPYVCGAGGTSGSKMSVSGAFYTESATHYGGFGSGGGYSNGNRVTFDANRYNRIYGNSGTVQPDAIRYPYYIVVATVVKTQILIDIDQVTSDLNLKADKSQFFNFERSTVLYDKTSTDADINWGQTAGIKGGVSIQAKNNFLAYKRLRFYVQFAGYQTEVYELDMEMPIPNATSERRTCSTALCADDSTSHYVSNIVYNTVSNNMRMDIGHTKGSTYSSRNNNSSYYIYKIEGIYYGYSN